MGNDESDEMESKEKKQPSKKKFFEAIDLIKSFAFFQKDIAKQLQKHTAQINELLTSLSCKNQSTIPSKIRKLTTGKGTFIWHSRATQLFYLNTSIWIFENPDFSNYFVGPLVVRKIGVKLYM